MNPKIITLFFALVISVSSCTLPIPDSPVSLVTSEPAAIATQTTGQIPEMSGISLYELPAAYPPPPIVPIPKSTLQIGNDSFDAYQIPGDGFRVLCKQPCGLDVRVMEALYGIYKVTSQAVIRTAGFDILDKMGVLDIHLDRDNTCTRFENEWGLTTSYTDNPDSIVICLYLLDSQMQSSVNPLTPENAIRSNGVGVFAHEFVHALLFGRFASSHDFVYPIEYMTANPDNSTYYGNLCESVYQANSPLSYQLCMNNGFTFEEMIQSMLDINRLYDDGYGNQPRGLVGYNQYRAILENLLGGDVNLAFDNAGYQKIFIEEGNTPYTLPYKNEPCTYRASLVGDGTIPQGSMLDENASFEKTWRIKNIGTCNWDDVQLIYVRGEAMTSTTTVLVPPTAAGAEGDVTVPMKAPSESGVHAGEWRLRNAAGNDFGPIFNLTIYTRSGCSLPPEISSFIASPPTIGPGALSLLNWGQVTNSDSVEIAGFGSVDPNGGRLLVQPDQTTTYTLHATCGERSTSSQVTVNVDKSLPPFAISNISVIADPAEYSGYCGGGIQINFYGTFDANSPGVVRYQWLWSDGTVSNPDISIVDEAGSKSITQSWTLSGSLESYLDLKILAPMEQEPVRADFTLTCSP